MNDIKVKIGLDGVPQVQAGANAAAQALGGLGDKVQRFGAGTKVTGQQTAQLSAQLQDFFVQVQAGGSPLTAFIQQGSQLSAVFGGFGNAARAVASVITPTVAAIGAAGAAIGTLGYAYVAAQREQEAFRRSIVLTGNAAGVTAGQLNDLAKAATVGSRGTNADVLAQLVSSGQVASSVLAKAAEAAVRLERDGGVAIKDTVAAFADLGKSPLQALERLNQSQNFLTLSTYKQVAALVEQGRAAEAAQVAQEAYASSGIERTKQLEQSLGDVEKAWRYVTEGAQAAWDAILAVGRPSSTSELFAKAQEGIETLQRVAANRQAAGMAADPAFQARMQQAQQRLESLRLQLYTEGELADAERARAAAATAAIAAEKQAAEEAKRAAKEREAALKRVREEAERLAAASIKAGQSLLESMALQDAGLNSDFLVKWEQLNAALRANPALNDRVRAAQAKLLEQQPFIKKGLDDRAKALQEAAKAQADYISSLDKSIAGNDRELQALRDQYVEVTAGKAARDELVQSRLDDAAAQAQQALASAELVGAGDAELERLGRIAQQLREVAALRRTVSTAVEAKDVADANAAAARKAAADWERTADSIRSSLTDAFRRAFESGEDFGTAMAKTIANELKARLATALAGALADNVLALAGVAVAGQGGQSQGLSALSTANTLGTLYSGAAKAYSLAGGTAATGTSAQFIAGYKGATLAEGVAGPTTAGFSGATGAGATAGNAAAFVSTWGAAIAAGIYKANQDYSEGFRREGAKAVGRETFGASGSFEFAQATLLTKLGFSDRLADLLSGATAVAKLIGYSNPTIRNAGVTGSITGGDFTGQATAEAVQKAGLARKLFGGGDKVTQLATDLPDEIGRFLDAGAAGILAKAKDYGAALGLPVDNLASVTAALTLKADQEGKLTQEALVQALSGYGDALVASYSAAVAPLATVGETTAQTLARVGESITGVNGVLNALGITALQASVDGGKAAVALEELFGGVATLQQAAGSYLQNYYTEAERAALTTESLAQTLGAFGLAVPTTRDGFRALVDAQDLTSQAGREAFTVLMGVADAFAAIAPAARSAADILAERTRLETELLTLQGDTAALRARERQGLDASNVALYDQIRALEDQKRALDDQRIAAEAAAASAQQLANAWRQSLGAAEDGVRSAYAAVAGAVQSAQQAAQSGADQAIQQLQSTSDQQLRTLESQAQDLQRTFGSLLDGLRGNIQQLANDLAADGGRGAALATLRDAQRTLRSGGLVDVDAVRAAGTVAARIDTGGFATAFDFRREQAGTRNLLREVSQAASAQLAGRTSDIAAQQVAIEQARDAQIAAIEKARDEQLAVLAAQLEEARASASALVSIDEGVAGVADALGRLAVAVGATSLLQGKGGPTGQVLQSGSQEVYGSAGGAVATRPAGSGSLADVTVRGKSGATAAGDVLAKAIAELIAADNWARIVEVALREGIDSNIVDALAGLAPGTARAAALLRGLPAFAVGSAYVPSTGPAIVHRGERILPAQDNAALMQLMQGATSGLDEALLRELLAELRALREQNMNNDAAIASHAARAANLLDDAINGGASIATRAEA